MKHISPERLAQLEPLLAALAEIQGLKEKHRGVFYRVKGGAFLHFHEDDDDVYADVKLTGPEFDRVKCTGTREQKKLLGLVRAALG